MSTTAAPNPPRVRSEALGAGFVPIVVAGAGGLCLSAAFDPVAVAVFAPVAVAAFAYAVVRATVREAIVRGLVFGVAFQGPLLAWLGDAVGVDVWAVVVVLESLWFAGLGATAVAVRRLPGWPVWVALLWVSMEVLRAAWPLGGMPWGRLGFTVMDSPWQGTLVFGGVVGAGFVVALVGASTGALAASWPAVRSHRRAVAAMGGLVAATCLGGWWAPAVAGASTLGAARVAVVQGGVPGDGTELVRYHRQVTDRQAEVTEQLAADWSTPADMSGSSASAPAFVLWPENATAVDPTRDAQAAQALDEARVAAGVPIFFGAVTDAPDPQEAFNQGLVWGSGGVEAPRYTKQHLVPFGEYIPLRSWLADLSPRLQAIGRDMQPGTAEQPLTIAGLRVGDALCFDVAYDDVLAPQVQAGAQLLTVQTSNAMFLGTSQLAQQFTISRVRAVETGRSVVVASVNGQSGAIGPDGSLIATLPQRDSVGTVVSVPLGTGETLAVRLGQAPSRVSLVLAGMGLAAAAVAGALRNRRRTSSR